MTTLWPFQKKAIEQIVANVRLGNLRQAIVMPTGTGKTVVIAHLLQALHGLLPGKKMLVIAHRTELIEQTSEPMLIHAYNPDLNVGVEQGNTSADSECDVLVASVSTLGRFNSKKHTRHNWKQKSGAIVVDECHHAAAETYRRLLIDFIGIVGKLVLGLTATPERSDKADLSDLFGREPVYQLYLVDAIKAGYLSDLIGVRAYTNVSLDRVATSAEDLRPKACPRLSILRNRNRQVVDAWLDNGKNRKPIVFCVTVAHANAITDEFLTGASRLKPYLARHSKEERRAKLARHKSGETKVLCNCAVLTEGYNDKSIGCVVLARPTKSRLLYIQMVWSEDCAPIRKTTRRTAF